MEKTKMLKIAAGALTIFILVFAGTKLFSAGDSGSSSIISPSKISKGKYQAVFLTNDQVYFGKIKDLESSFPVMEDVYYLVTAGPTQANVDTQTLEELEGAEGEDVTVSTDGSSAVGGFVLVYLGNEVHGPENKLVLNKDHILFVEDLKEDGKLVSAIKDSKTLEEQNTEVEN